MPRQALPLRDRIARRIDVDEVTGCWNWRAPLDREGYGCITVAKKKQRAHRVSYEVYRGEIPAGLLICHRCDNRRCVNPGHFFLGTIADNNKDMTEKGRLVVVDRKLTPADVIDLRRREAVRPVNRRVEAQRLGCDPSTLRSAIKGRTFAYLPQPE